MIFSTITFFSAIIAFLTASSSDKTFVASEAVSSVERPPSRRLT